MSNKFMAKTINIGPYHPALEEPELFTLKVEKEKIISVDIKPGYVHRGIEKLATSKTYYENIFLIERICGICSNAHTTCYCQSVEQLTETDVPKRAKYISTITAEMERLHSHYLWFSMLFNLLESSDIFIKILTGREHVMNLLELMSGNRVHYAMNTIGGVRRDLPEEMINKIRGSLNNIEHTSSIIEKAIKDKKVSERIKGVGYLSKEDAKKMCVVGPTLRGSCINSDIRKDETYLAYDEIEWNVQISDDGDCLSRSLVRLKETYESIKIINQLVSQIPLGEIVGDVGEIINDDSIGRVEAPRGELFYYIKSNGTNNIPYSVKIRTPTYMNCFALNRILVGESIENALLTIASIDPCFSCMDRVIIVDTKNRRKRGG